MTMIKKLLKNTRQERQRQRLAELYRSLIRHEAKIGGEIFGSTEAGRRREFFCLDEHTWVWHEEWQDRGETKYRTTRYDVRPSGILKSQNGTYASVQPDEASRLLDAARIYQQRVRSELYSAA